MTRRRRCWCCTGRSGARRGYRLCRLCGPWAVHCHGSAGFVRSDGKLAIAHVTVSALAETVVSAADSRGLDRFDLAGRDIGGGIAQFVASTGGGPFVPLGHASK